MTWPMTIASKWDMKPSIVTMPRLLTPPQCRWRRPVEVGDHGLRWHLPIRHLLTGQLGRARLVPPQPRAHCLRSPFTFPGYAISLTRGVPECNRACKVVILFIFLIQDSDQLEWLDDDDRLLGMQTVLMSWFKVGKLCGSERGALIVSIMFHDLVQRNNATTMESWTQHWVVRLGKFSTPSHNVTERGRDQLKKKLQTLWQLVPPPPCWLPRQGQCRGAK